MIACQSIGFASEITLFLKIMQPLVSIIIPTYNREKLVIEAVEACLTQTYQPIEIIIIDDGSKDNTEAVVQRRLRTDWSDANVRYFRQENGGSCSARNHGLSLATGKYLQFLDSDDFLFPGKISRHVAELEKPENEAAEFCYSLGRMVSQADGFSQPVGRKCEKTADLLKALVSREVHVMQTNACLWRYEFLIAREGWRLGMGFCDDFEYYVRLVAQSTSFVCIPEVLFEMKIHPGERLSTERLNQEQIAALLHALRSVYETIAPTVFWTEETISSYLGKCRTHYANILEFGEDADLDEIEEWVIPVARKRRAGLEIRMFAILRKLVGLSATRFIFNCIMNLRRQ